MYVRMYMYVYLYIYIYTYGCICTYMSTCACGIPLNFITLLYVSKNTTPCRSESAAFR